MTNLDQYTFGQLLKLAQPETLIEVTRGYHAFLRAEVPDATVNGIYSYALAEASLEPHLTRCWREKLNFLTGGELKAALRKAAEKQKIAPMIGHPHPFMVINRFKFPNYKARLALSGLILMHCRHNGVPASCKVNAQEDFEITTECGPFGHTLLRYKPGLKWQTIEKFCYEMGISVWLPFPWVSHSLPFGTRVNPCVWPVNSPDVNETASQLI